MNKKLRKRKLSALNKSANFGLLGLLSQLKGDRLKSNKKEEIMAADLMLLELKVAKEKGESKYNDVLRKINITTSMDPIEYLEYVIVSFGDAEFDLDTWNRVKDIWRDKSKENPLHTHVPKNEIKYEDPRASSLRSKEYMEAPMSSSSRLPGVMPVTDPRTTERFKANTAGDQAIGKLLAELSPLGLMIDVSNLASAIYTFKEKVKKYKAQSKTNEGERAFNILLNNKDIDGDGVAEGQSIGFAMFAFLPWVGDWWSAAKRRRVIKKLDQKILKNRAQFVIKRGEKGYYWRRVDDELGVNMDYDANPRTNQYLLNDHADEVDTLWKKWSSLSSEQKNLLAELSGDNIESFESYVRRTYLVDEPERLSKIDPNAYGKLTEEERLVGELPREDYDKMLYSDEYLEELEKSRIEGSPSLEAKIPGSNDFNLTKSKISAIDKDIESNLSKVRWEMPYDDYYKLAGRSISEVEHKEKIQIISKNIRDNNKAIKKLESEIRHRESLIDLQRKKLREAKNKAHWDKAIDPQAESKLDRINRRILGLIEAYNEGIYFLEVDLGKLNELKEPLKNLLDLNVKRERLIVDSKISRKTLKDIAEIQVGSENADDIYAFFYDKFLDAPIRPGSVHSKVSPSQSGTTTVLLENFINKDSEAMIRLTNEKSKEIGYTTIDFDRTNLPKTGKAKIIYQEAAVPIKDLSAEEYLKFRVIRDTGNANRADEALRYLTYRQLNNLESPSKFKEVFEIEIEEYFAYIPEYKRRFPLKDPTPQNVSDEIIKIKDNLLIKDMFDNWELIMTESKLGIKENGIDDIASEINKNYEISLDWPTEGDLHEMNKLERLEFKHELFIEQLGFAPKEYQQAKKYNQDVELGIIEPLEEAYFDENESRKNRKKRIKGIRQRRQ